MKKWMLGLLMMAAVALGAWLGCPLFELTGITCPLCGVTRAWIACLRGDFSLAITCNPLFFPIPLWFVGVLLWDGPLKGRKWARGLLLGFAAVLFAMNALRWARVIPLPPGL